MHISALKCTKFRRTGNGLGQPEYKIFSTVWVSTFYVQKVLRMKISNFGVALLKLGYLYFKHNWASPAQVNKATASFLSIFCSHLNDFLHVRMLLAQHLPLILCLSANVVLVFALRSTVYSTLVLLTINHWKPPSIKVSLWECFCR